MSATLLLKRHAKIREKQALENAKKKELLSKDLEANVVGIKDQNDAMLKDPPITENNKTNSEVSNKINKKGADKEAKKSISENRNQRSKKVGLKDGEKSEGAIQSENVEDCGKVEERLTSRDDENAKDSEKEEEGVTSENSEIANDAKNKEETISRNSEDADESKMEEGPISRDDENADSARKKEKDISKDCEGAEDSKMEEEAISRDSEDAENARKKKEDISEDSEDAEDSKMEEEAFSKDNKDANDSENTELVEDAQNTTADLEGEDIAINEEVTDDQQGTVEESNLNSSKESNCDDSCVIVNDEEIDVQESDENEEDLMIENDESEEECEIVSDEEEDVISVDDSVESTENSESELTPEKKTLQSQVSVVDLSSEPYEVVDLCSDEEEDVLPEETEGDTSDSEEDSPSNEPQITVKESSVCEIVNLDDSKENIQESLKSEKETAGEVQKDSSCTSKVDVATSLVPEAAKDGDGPSGVETEEKNDAESVESSSSSIPKEQEKESSTKDETEELNSSESSSSSQQPLFFEDRVGERKPKKKKAPKPSRTVKKQKLSVVAYKVVKKEDEEGESRIEIPVDDLSANPQKGGGPPRPIVIDGFSVAVGHGRRKVFSSKGLKMCIDYFRNKGHSVKAILPRWRLRDSQSSHYPTRDIDILKKLDEENVLVLTPSSCGFDNVCGFVLQYAVEMGGIVVSDHSFQNIKMEQPEWEEVVENRRLIPTWVDDLLIFPKDPLGQKGPNLEQFLQFEKTENFDDSDDESTESDESNTQIEDVPMKDDELPEVIDID